MPLISEEFCQTWGPLRLSLGGACPHVCSLLDFLVQTHSETCHSTIPILTFLLISFFNLSLLPVDYLRPSSSLLLCLVMSGLLLNL